MPGERKILATARIGRTQTLVDWAVKGINLDDPMAFDVAVDTLRRPFMMEHPTATARPLIARPKIAALVTTPAGGLIGVVTLLNEYLGYLGWMETVAKTDYPHHGMSGRGLRGVGAALIGNNARPDQIALCWLDDLSERDLRKQREQAAASVIISPVGWTKRVSENYRRKCVDGYEELAQKASGKNKRKVKRNAQDQKK